MKNKNFAFFNKFSIKGTAATWILFSVFILVLIAIEIVSNWLMFHLVRMTSLMAPYAAFFSFWLSKLYIPLFLAFFTLLTKRKWWTLVLLCLFDIWAVSNIIYMQSNNSVLTWESIMLASNLNGFTSSIEMYLNDTMLLFPLMTLGYALLLLFLRPKPVGKKSIWIVASVFVLLYGIQSCCYTIVSRRELGIQSNLYAAPFLFHNSIRANTLGYNEHYCVHHSILSYLPFYFKNEEQHFSEEDDKKMHAAMDTTTINDSIAPKRNLLIVLVESLEDFALQATDVNGNKLLPNLSAFTEERNVFYANKITSQTSYGVSIDGQQIITTGLLPINYGVGSMSFGKNSYPNFAHLFDVAKLSNPAWWGTWNQDVVTYSYGFDEMLGGEHDIKDAETFAKIIPNLPKSADSTFCYLAITLDSHSPFDRIPKNPTLQFDPEMPEILQNYFTCLHYTDSCFGAWYNDWRLTPQADNTVLLVTGDHTVFFGVGSLQNFTAYAEKANLSVKSGKTFCPLIISSPDIAENTKIDEVCYQMDIYPSILHAIGTENYFWKGFGVNLLDSATRKNRPDVPVEDFFRLSDKLIRSNYFEAIIE